MDVRLSKRGDYVIRSALCLARAYDAGDRRKIRDVVFEMSVPKGFASQILLDLVRAGIAESQAGKDGGYRLTRPPDQISVLELVEAGEGELAFDKCALGDGPCPFDSVCPLHDTWTVAVGALRDALASTTLAELLRRELELGSCSYAMAPDAHRYRQPGVPIDDLVQVEAAAEVVEEKLISGGSWLSPLAMKAHGEGEDLRIRIGPGGPSWLAKAVSVRLGALRREGEHAVVPLSWDATGLPGLFPRLEAQLQVRALDPERSELRVSGYYFPPLGRTGKLVDEAVLGRLARATVRSFLRQVARTIEDAPANSVALMEGSASSALGGSGGRTDAMPHVAREGSPGHP